MRRALALEPLVEETLNAFFLLMIKLGNFVVLLNRFCLEVRLVGRMVLDRDGGDGELLSLNWSATLLLG